MLALLDLSCGDCFFQNVNFRIFLCSLLKSTVPLTLHLPARLMRCNHALVSTYVYVNSDSNKIHGQIYEDTLLHKKE